MDLAPVTRNFLGRLGERPGRCKQQEPIMSAFRPSLFLRRALLADAAISGATGVLLLVGANLVDALLGLPSALLREAGIFLIPYGAVVGFLGIRERVTAAAVWAVIACNGLW